MFFGFEENMGRDFCTIHFPRVFLDVVILKRKGDITKMMLNDKNVELVKVPEASQRISI
jgi:hypothetical protein